MNSRKPNAQRISAWLIKEIIPRDFNNKIMELQEDDQLAITERNSRIQDLEFNNVGLHEEITAHTVQTQDLITNRHVPRRCVIENVLSLIDKKCENELHKWFMTCCQYRAFDNHRENSYKSNIQA